MAACEVDGKKSAENIDYSITPVQRQASWSAAASQQGYAQMGAWKFGGYFLSRRQVLYILFNVWRYVKLLVMYYKK